MNRLIRSVQINGVEFNSNRDPQFYRRSVNEPFSIQLFLTGTGRADATMEIAGEGEDAKSVELPGRIAWEARFESAGTRVGRVTVTCGDQSEYRDLRFDVEAHAWVG